ncbi:hypothetical protein [Alkanindiges illinoisensis]|uniref:hypothetical protein n=1 Tax=Alkanindiges illinoisensis TaxID=197183 RepID=UPI00047980CF|nr:hypothetical protein [Alkanindiges illinoisensis]
MTLDQKLALANVIGTWLASIGTIAAVIVSLWLVRRTGRIQLKIESTTALICPDGRMVRCIVISVTNLGDRTVTITNIRWKIGKGKSLTENLQFFSLSLGSTQFPTELEHGKSGHYFLELFREDEHNWEQPFILGFVKDLSPKHLDTLRIEIKTSIGQMVQVRPGKQVLEFIKNHKFN